MQNMKNQYLTIKNEKWKNIPWELRQLTQWVCWKFEKKAPDDVKLTKVPKNPLTGKNAQTTNASTWGTFFDALKACELFDVDGIGFVFTKNDNYFGVDLDHVDDNPELCKEFINTLKSYTEYSQSGTGLHIICKGALPDGARRKGNIEMYSDGRYFVFTGNIVNPELNAIVNCTETIKALHKKYLPFVPRDSHTKQACGNGALFMSDKDLLERIQKSKHSLLFNMLFSGDYASNYDSHSNADIALCNILAFWTGCDYNRIDSIFRESGLMRAKWDEMRGSETYGHRTINKAITDCRAIYEPIAPETAENVDRWIKQLNANA